MPKIRHLLHTTTTPNSCKFAFWTTRIQNRVTMKGDRWMDLVREWNTWSNLIKTKVHEIWKKKRIHRISFPNLKTNNITICPSCDLHSPEARKKKFYKLRTHKLIHLYRTFLATPLQIRFDIQNSSFDVTSKVTDSRAVSRQQPGIFFSIFPKKHYAVVVLQISWLFMTQYAKSPIFCFITQTMETYVSFEFSTRR